MALNKQITLDNGVVTNYHRISEVFLRSNDMVVPVENQFMPLDGTIPEVKTELVPQLTLIVKVASYISKEIRDTSSQNYINIIDYGYDITEEESKGNLRELGYNKLKEEDRFEGATDC